MCLKMFVCSHRKPAMQGPSTLLCFCERKDSLNGLHRTILALLVAVAMQTSLQIETCCCACAACTFCRGVDRLCVLVRRGVRVGGG